MDAFVLETFETRRCEGTQSRPWLARQQRKIDGGLKAMDELVKNRKGEYLIENGDVMTIADIAVACAVGQIDFGGIRPDWKTNCPSLVEWLDKMDSKKTFNETKPVMFDWKDVVV